MAQVEFHSNPQLSFIREDYQGNAFQDGQYLPYTPYQHPGFWDIMKWQLSSNPQKQEKKEDDFSLEVVKGTDFLEEERDFILWLGHASFLIRLSGLTLLLDPCLRSLPLLPRKAGLPCEIGDIKGVDYILMSHGHRDHFDIPSLKTLIPNNFGVEMLVPLGMSALIESIGMERYQEAGWYQEYQTDEKLNITFLPAHHWNRRGLNDHNRMLWGSFLIESFDQRIYFAADTGYANHFKEIREVIGEGIDLCLMPIGAYKPPSIMKNSHTSPEEAVQAFHELEGSRFIPMHYGTYDLADEPLGEPIRKVRKMAEGGKLEGELVELKVGEIYYL